ncbi:uncharacterized protein TrAFT101_004458 [Trichoderma asperellum]|uniref:uncharacterized protein n=1 Tax=Trichoderma asperellum TaxID=101201 RepID=UPI0033342C93|nr:hypothetical protein TrAFT101_004458 [Trichoderma asperellum]
MPSTSTAPVRRLWRIQGVGSMQLKLATGAATGRDIVALEGPSGAWGLIMNPWNNYPELRPKGTRNHRR